MLKIFVIWWTYSWVSFSSGACLSCYRSIRLETSHSPLASSTLEWITYQLPRILEYGNFHELQSLTCFWYTFIVIISFSLALILFHLYTDTHFIYSQVFQMYVLCSFFNWTWLTLVSPWRIFFYKINLHFYIFTFLIIYMLPLLKNESLICKWIFIFRDLISQIINCTDNKWHHDSFS